MTPCLNAPRHQTQLSPVPGGQDGGVPVSGRTGAKIHGGLMDTLLVAATQEDDLVTELLQAFARNRRQRVVELATAIASNRGSFQGNGVSSNAQTPGTGKPVMPRPVAYRDKLLVAIQREEILIESLVAASAKGARTQLFSLCRDLAMNRGHIDPEFRWANNFPEDLSP